MAEHGPAEYASAKGNDLSAHEAMYDRFVHLALVGGAHIANIILGLAVGALAGHWLVAIALMFIATGVAVLGFATGARLPSVVMVVVSLLALALAAGGGSPT